MGLLSWLLPAAPGLRAPGDTVAQTLSDLSLRRGGKQRVGPLACEGGTPELSGFRMNPKP